MKPMEERILIVDDDITFALMLRTWLSKRGFGVGTASSVAAARTALEAGGFSLVLSDMRLPDEDGIALLQWMAGAGVAAPVIVMTSYAEIQNAVRCMKLGARDYVAKPVNPDELLKKIREALDVPAVPAAKSASKPAPRAAGSFSEQPLNYIEGRSDAARQLYEHIRLVAPTNMSVLVNGASGTGKEHVAQLIHRESKRAGKPFVAVDCGAIPRDLAASEFFGHVKGAFTGALADKTGAFEAADGGTLFLDEVAELPMETQALLLRVLESGEYMRVGSSDVRKTDVRIVAATNKNLENAIKEGKFREDLYYRLCSVRIDVPPLRRRGDDIWLLIRRFSHDFSEKYRTPEVEYSDEAKKAMLSYRWPGNVRQLKNVAEQIALFEAGNRLSVENVAKYLPNQEGLVSVDGAVHDYMHEREYIFKMLYKMQQDVVALQSALQERRMPETATTTFQLNDEMELLKRDSHKLTKLNIGADDDTGKPKKIIDLNSHDTTAVDKHDFEAPYAMEVEAHIKTLDETERETITRALERNNGKRKRTAEELNISERTLYRKIKEYGLESRNQHKK